MTKPLQNQSGLAQTKPVSRRMTFRPPTPSPRLIHALVPINRWLMLGGIPGLRAIPGLGSVPGIRGIMNVPEIEFPITDQERLAATVNDTTAAFITPNHPEFFTDWMLDKEVISRVAPLAACWATHDIVNGLGAYAQKFWLKNNLIAQIPGAGGQAGKDYSVGWARQGKGVLLHPEGSVGWHGDVINTLFPGAAEMALETFRQVNESGEARTVFIAPVVWKLFFTKDVTRGLHKDLSYIEKSLHLPRHPTMTDPADRLYQIYDALLARDEVKWHVHPTDAPYFERLTRLQAKLNERLEHRLETKLGEDTALLSPDNVVRSANRWLRGADKDDPSYEEIKSLSKNLTRLGRVDPKFYPSVHLSQEHVAESAKRIRNDYCRGGLRNTAHNYVPVPVGPRRAVIRVPDPVNVTQNGDQPSDVLTGMLRDRMQGCIDRINKDQSARQKALPHFPNPFL